MSQSMSQTLCSDRPILTMDPGFSPPDQKETQTEIMFEKFPAPAYFISHKAALSAFSLGRHTAMVVDCGGGEQGREEEGKKNEDQTLKTEGGITYWTTT